MAFSSQERAKNRAFGPGAMRRYPGGKEGGYYKGYQTEQNSPHLTPNRQIVGRPNRQGVVNGRVGSWSENYAQRA